ncbi:MAG TPA: hypothetical protein VJS12_26095 [Steroidobacteraceae bacterium]|nr:hypothetical protein [Steroidobacteraceae bacterium]
MSSIRAVQCFIAAALGCASLQASANTFPPQEPVQFDGHYYQVIPAWKISWEASKTGAEQRTFQGVQGHLATIGSPEEDAFLEQLRARTLSALHPWFAATELWVGGFQVRCATANPEPACGWMWLNGDPIAPTNGSSPYTNWLSGEPNNQKRTPDAMNRATEDFLAIGHKNQFGWNDEGALPNVWGYIVEYGEGDLTVPALSCAFGSGGCNPTGAQVITLPASAQIDPGATLTARVTTIHDDPARCGKEPLTLFDGAVVLPPYLCGHPDFLVIETHTEGVQVLTGAIEVENLTEDALPNNLYGCTPFRQNPAGQFDFDPSHRDVVGWQSQDPQQMLETSLGTGRFRGTVTEVTYACGSSRGKVLNGSYQFVGLRIHPGPGNELADGNPGGNHKSFIDLVGYKLKVLQASLLASKAALPKLQYEALKERLDGAVSAHNKRDYRRALLKIQLFLKAVEQSSYQPIAGKNFNGDHLMRGSNIEFMYAEKILPFD